MNVNEIFSGIKKFLFDKGLRTGFLARIGFYNNMSDEKFLKKQFKAAMGEELDLDNPKTYNAKLQWLKLYNRKSEYTTMVDKYAVKAYVADKIGEQYIIPTLGIWDNPDDINFDELPDKFVLKCNHNSHKGLCICTDKSKLDIKKTVKELKEGLKSDCYLIGREWPYKDVKRKVICEKYMTDTPDSSCLTDYKFFCFDGFVDSVMVAIDRNIGDTKFYFFDKEWNLLRYNKRGKDSPENFTIPKPETMDEMFDVASKLSEGLPAARIDLYSCDNKVYFGEITFFSSSGFDNDILKDADLHLGELIDLSKVKKD